MKIGKPTVLLKRNHYIKCFCFIQNVANKNINKVLYNLWKNMIDSLFLRCLRKGKGEGV